MKQLDNFKNKEWIKMTRKSVRYEQDWLSGVLDQDSLGEDLFDSYEDIDSITGDLITYDEDRVYAKETSDQANLRVSHLGVVIELDPWDEKEVDRYTRERVKELTDSVDELDLSSFLDLD